MFLNYEVTTIIILFHPFFIFRIFHIINVFGLIGNISFLVCIIKSPNLKSFELKMFGNLSVVDLISDLLFILWTILYKCFNLGESPRFMEYICVSNICYVTIGISSIYMLVAISYHRFLGFTSYG